MLREIQKMALAVLIFNEGFGPNKYILYPKSSGGCNRTDLSAIWRYSASIPPLMFVMTSSELWQYRLLSFKKCEGEDKIWAYTFLISKLFQS